MNSSSEREQLLTALFDAHETVGFKRNVYEAAIEPDDSTLFFCINPLMRPNDFNLSNVAHFRNFLVEIDDRKLDAQERLIKRLELPYATKTFSGNKSYHYIVSLDEPIKDYVTYKLYAELIYNIVKVMDQRCSNGNRLSRLAGSVRENSVRQDLLTVRPRITKKQLDYWIYQTHAKVTAQFQVEREQQLQARADAPQVITATTRALLERGEVRVGASRHEALLAAAVNLYHNGKSLDELEGLLYEAADKLGLDDSRGDVPGIMKWIARNL